MCIIERKTYHRSDGRIDTVETSRPCRHADGSRPCRNVEYKTMEPVRIVERKPATSRSSNDGMIVTEGSGGRARVYRDVTKRPSRRKSVRQSKTTGHRTSAEQANASSSSSSHVEARPAAPTPPRRTSPDLAQPRYLPEEPLSPLRTLAPDGTAIYELPPSLGLPRAGVNERRPMPPPLRPRDSISSMTAEIDDPPAARPRRRPSLNIDTSRPSGSASPPDSASGLSDRPKVGNLRHDSARPAPREKRTSERVRFSESPRSSPGARELARRRRRQEEDQRQAQLERDRLAASDRRQEARQREASDERRERHRREATEALEGRRDDDRQRKVDADLRQMAKEREEAAARRRDSDASAEYTAYRLSRDADARYARTRTSPRLSRRGTNEGSPYSTYNPSPLSARSPSYPVQLHHYPSARRNSNAIYERGEQVIADVQARAERAERPYPADRARRASQRLEDVLGVTRADDVYDDGYEVTDEYYGDPNLPRGSGRARRSRYQ